MTTISVNKTLGVVLNPASYTNPIVIDAGVTISNSGGDGVAATTGSWTIENAGSIVVTSTNGSGVTLNSGGSVTNAASASITSDFLGVWITGAAGTVVNDGRIAGTGSSGEGVDLQSSGSVTNATSASITGGFLGVAITGGIGTVVNYGSIAGTGTFSAGVDLFSGGVVTNAANASITGDGEGVVGTGTVGTGTVVNDGSIVGAGTRGVGVDLASGGSVTNSASGSIEGYRGVYIGAAAGTVVNNGSIVSTSASTLDIGAVGVFLDSGGSVTNAASGSIKGANFGVEAFKGGATVVNDGSIAGTGGTVDEGVYLRAGGSVINAAFASITGAVFGVVTGDGIGTGGAGTVVNDGSIASGGGGVYLFSGGSVTNAASASITGGNVGVGFNFAAGTVVNDGNIAGTGTNGAGLRLFFGGSVTNGASAAITGVAGGVAISGSAGTVVNDGTIGGIGTNFANIGIDFLSGGSAINAAAASIIGVIGIYNVGTVVNNGSIIGVGAKSNLYGFTIYSGTGVETNSIINGSVTNAASASIIGSVYGVHLAGGGTLTNAGTIIGSGRNTVGTKFGTGVVFGGTNGTLTNSGIITGNNGTAVAFSGTGSNLLVLDPGFGLSGLVSGGRLAINTLELASAASSGMLSGLGSEYINFTQTTIDIGATWTLTGTNTVSAGQTITNSGSLKLLGVSLTVDGSLVNDGTINVDPSSLIAASIGGVGTIEIGANGTLTATGAVSVGETIAFTGTNGVLNILHSADFAGTITGQGPTDQVNIACFAAGTRLLTVSGEVAVEALALGDLVVTRSTGLHPVRWIGHRHVDCRHHPRPQDVQPVRVCADAFANGMPHRDLLLSPDHAVFIDGVLIPIRYLINGRTIVQEAANEVTYYHVELEQHDVILAEGLPCESYLDTGNRGAFTNGGDALMLHPDFALKVWETRAYAELVLDGPKLQAARTAVLARAETLGHRLTSDPGLSVVVDGRTLPATITDKSWLVTLPTDAQIVRLVSHAWVPGHVMADNDDTRSLGVAIANVRHDGRTLTLDDSRLCSGWLEPEAGWRWTNGDATLRVVGVRELAFDVVMTGSYWEAPAELETMPACEIG